MNSYSKGTAFENQVYCYLKNELVAGRLLVNPNTSSIYQKKSYYSRDRDKNIVTDISIEVGYEDKSKIGFLILIECKDYNHPVPVDDVEEFYAKVTQISGLNVKAIFVTTASLQSGAYNFASSKKISVIRMLPEEQIERLLFLSFPNQFRNTIHNNSSQKIFEALTCQEYIGSESDFICVCDSLQFGNWADLLKFLTSKGPDKANS